MKDIIVIPKEISTLSVLDRARTLTVTDKATYEAAGCLLKINLDGRKQVEAWFAPLKKSAQDHHKSIVAAEKKELEPYDQAEEILKSGMARFAELNAAVWPEEGDGAEGEKLKGAVETWACSVNDHMALIRHVAANPALIHLLTPNTKELDAMAKRQKEMFNLPGCAAVKKMTIRS